MIKIVCYVNEEVEGSVGETMNNGSLANFLWDHNLEVVNIKAALLDKDSTEWEKEEQLAEKNSHKKEKDNSNELVAFHDATGGSKQ